MGVGGEWDLESCEGGMKWCFVCFFVFGLWLWLDTGVESRQVSHWQTTFEEVVSAAFVCSKFLLAAEMLCGIKFLPTWLKALTWNRRPCVRQITPISITASTNQAMSQWECNRYAVVVPTAIVSGKDRISR
jgi:hypothetical protein